MNIFNKHNLYQISRAWLASFSYHLLECELCMSALDSKWSLSDSKAMWKLRFWLSFIPPQSEKNMLLVRHFIFLPSISSNSPSELPCMHIIAADGCISNIKTASLKRSVRCSLFFWVERDRMVYWSLLMSTSSLAFSKVSVVRVVCCTGMDHSCKPKVCENNSCNDSTCTSVADKLNRCRCLCLYKLHV